MNIYRPDGRDRVNCHSPFRAKLEPQYNIYISISISKYIGLILNLNLNLSLYLSIYIFIPSGSLKSRAPPLAVPTSA